MVELFYFMDEFGVFSGFRDAFMCFLLVSYGLSYELASWSCDL